MTERAIVKATPAPDFRPRADSGAFSFTNILDILARRWLLIVSASVSITVIVISVSLMMVPKYDATVTLKINPNHPSAIDANANESRTPDQFGVESEVVIMKSRDIAAAVAKRFDLAKNVVFLDEVKIKPWAREDPAVLNQKVIDALIDNLSIDHTPMTYVVGMSYRSLDPNRAAAIANAFGEEYLQSTVDRRTAVAARQARWLDERLAAIGQEAEAADSAIARYRAEQGITTSEATGTITDQQIAPLSGQLATAEAEAAAARSSLSAARMQMASGGLDAVSGVLNSTTISDLRRQRTEVARQRDEVNTRYGPKHPETLKVTQQLQGIDHSLNEEAQRIVSSLDSQARSADASVASLRASLNEIRARQSSDMRANVLASSLERQAEAKRTVYNKLAAAAQQFDQEERSLEPQGAIVERATVPSSPSSPKKKLFALVGAILGLIVGLLLAVLLEMLQTGVRTVADVEHGLGVPFLTSVPRINKKRLKALRSDKMSPADYVIYRPMSSYAEALRWIRNSLVLQRERRPRVISILSAVPGEGKSSMASALGRIMALSGDRVILIDCDLRRGGLSQLLQNVPSVGLAEVLNGQSGLREAIKRDVGSSLDVLPLAKASFTPKDMFGGDAMRSLLERLTQSYDVVLLDTPPLLGVADARTLAALADVNLMVVKWRYTPHRVVRSALGLLEQDNTPIIGVALSMVGTTARAIGVDNPMYTYGMNQGYYQE